MNHKNNQNKSSSIPNKVKTRKFHLISKNLFSNRFSNALFVNFSRKKKYCNRRYQIFPNVNNFSDGQLFAFTVNRSHVINFFYS